jgi:hypothetical protein
MERQKGRFIAAERLVELSNRSLHRDGSGKLKAEMEQVKGQIDQFDAQRRNAREVLRQSWEGLQAGQ